MKRFTDELLAELESALRVRRPELFALENRPHEMTSDLEPSRDLTECARWAKETGDFRSWEFMRRWMNLSPRVKAEIRRKWKESDERKN
jgi:hypothetical protein